MARKNQIKVPQYIPMPHVPCAFENCLHRAMIVVDTPTGKAKLCYDHYELHYAKVARDWCLSRGLDTTDKCRQFVKDNIRKIGRMREPGEDEDFKLPS